LGRFYGIASIEKSPSIPLYKRGKKKPCQHSSVSSIKNQFEELAKMVAMGAMANKDCDTVFLKTFCLASTMEICFIKNAF